ncbi:MAG TPA: hypothetical protein C5S50_03110 [Methanosarcinaceae archaeon]|nr:hypothetical protein [Methanosarcinaceae archaeon]
MSENNSVASKIENYHVGIDIFDIISADDAYRILQILANENQTIAKQIEQIAVESLVSFEIEDIADDVYLDLNSLEVEDVWYNSGNTRYGYVDPTEYAWEMFEEALEPYMEDIKKYQKLSMPVEAKKCCMGILKGIDKFETESTSEYKDWAVDATSEFLKQVVDEWKKGQNSQEDITEVEKLMARF